MGKVSRHKRPRKVRNLTYTDFTKGKKKFYKNIIFLISRKYRLKIKIEEEK